MRLLFDQNLSPALVQRLSDVHPGSAHVLDFGLSRASDTQLLDVAEREGFVLVSKDSDFFDPALLRGHRAKIVWLRRGNCSTAEVESILRAHATDIEHLFGAENLNLLMLY